MNIVCLLTTRIKQKKNEQKKNIEKRIKMCFNDFELKQPNKLFKLRKWCMMNENFNGS